MNALRSYLWKEWREQRATLALLALALAAGVGGLALALPRAALGDAITFHGIVALTLLGTAMSLGSDLLARERAGNSLTFLERLPLGLGAAFRAKLGFFLAALCLALLYGVALAGSATWLRAGHLPADLLQDWTPLVLAAILVGALWIFAASAWVPAGALSTPFALFLIAALAWPAVLVVRESPRFSTPAVLGFALLCLVGAVASAWASFVLGSRRGGSRVRATLSGIGVAALAFLPSWAFAAAHFSAPSRAPFEVQHGFVGVDARYAFLNLTRRAPTGLSKAARARYDRTSALVVDLERGVGSFAGDIDGSAFVPEHAPGQAQLAPGTMTRLRLVGTEGDGLVLDTRTAAPCLMQDAPAGVPNLTLADLGLHARLYRSVHVQTAGIPAGSVEHMTARYRDPASGVRVDAADLGVDPSRVAEVLVRPGRWIVLDRDRWVWFDPRSKVSEPLSGVEPGDHLGPLVSDGRVLLRAQGGLWLFDPDSGERRAIRVACEGETYALGHATGHGGILPADEPYFVRFATRLRPESRARSEVTFSGYGLLDPSALTLEPVVPLGNGPTRLLHVQGLQAIALEGRAELVRYDLEMGTREVLFSIESVR